MADSSGRRDRGQRPVALGADAARCQAGERYTSPSGNGDQTPEQAEVIPMKPPHRPVAMESTEQPEYPLSGIARNYSELVALLRHHRRHSELSQLELDERAGFQDGYTGKLEIPHKADGRSAVRASFNLWIGALEVGIMLVPLKKARKGWKRQRITG